MTELFFFYSLDDPSVIDYILSNGYILVVNEDYYDGKRLKIYSKKVNKLYKRYFILPNRKFISNLSVRSSTKNSGKKFNYIQDRVGSASIDLIFYTNPNEFNICVGSLSFQTKTYDVNDGTLRICPEEFSKTHRDISSYIKNFAQKISNQKTPKTVYVFPHAMAIIRGDFSRSPWPSIIMP